MIEPQAALKAMDHQGLIKRNPVKGGHEPFIQIYVPNAEVEILIDVSIHRVKDKIPSFIWFEYEDGTLSQTLLSDRTPRFVIVGCRQIAASATFHQLASIKKRQAERDTRLLPTSQ